MDFNNLFSRIINPENEIITFAAQQGDADAQYLLGLYFCTGEECVPDFKEAVKWFRKAAEQGHSDAQNNLGVCYSNGDGVSQNFKEAIKWYRKAAEQGNVSAQLNLAICYTDDQNVIPDYQEAVNGIAKQLNRDIPTHNFVLVFVMLTAMASLKMVKKL